MTDRIHPSALGKWATCPKHAYAALSGGGPEPVPAVAEWIGSCAHARIAGSVAPDIPGGYTFWDSITPNIYAATQQIINISDAVTAYLANNGYRVYESEFAVENDWVEGTIDLLVKKDVENQLAIADVKTGQRVPLGVWHQLGAYAETYNMDHSGPYVEGLFVLHAPRTRLNEEQPLKAYHRQAKGCAEAAMVLVKEVDDWMNTRTLDSMPAMPGIGCASCSLDCAVRAWGDE